VPKIQRAVWCDGRRTTRCGLLVSGIRPQRPWVPQVCLCVCMFVCLYNVHGATAPPAAPGFHRSSTVCVSVLVRVCAMCEYAYMCVCVCLCVCVCMLICVYVYVCVRCVSIHTKFILTYIYTFHAYIHIKENLHIHKNTRARGIATCPLSVKKVREQKFFEFFLNFFSVIMCYPLVWEQSEG